MKKRLLIIGVIICLLVSGCGSTKKSDWRTEENWFENRDNAYNETETASVSNTSTETQASIDINEKKEGTSTYPSTILDVDIPEGCVAVVCDGNVIVGEPDKSRYYRTQLNSEEQTAYDEIYLIISKMLGESDISTLDGDVITTAVTALMYDFPEFFYLSSYKYMQYTLNGVLEKISFIGEYSMSEAQRDVYQSYIDKYEETFKTQISSDMSDYEIAKKLYEFIAWNTEYVTNAPENQNILSVVCYGQSVCSGYAKTYQYIMNNLGFDTVFVTGFSKKTGEYHAWLMIKLDGEYYNIDPTWGDTSVPGFSTDYISPALVCYDYFCSPDTWNDATHQVEFFEPLPSCTATEDNFYIHTGLYVESTAEAELNRVIGVCKNQNYGLITFKCSNAQIYSYWMDYLFSQSHIFEYIDGTNGVSYSSDDSTYVIIVG